MSQVESLMRAQAELYGRISRSIENLKKTGAAKITLGTVEARLQALESHWVKFEANHDQILLAPPVSIAESDYIKLGTYSLAEDAYLQQKGNLGGNVRTTLPRIQLPCFSGKYEDWPAFRDLFQSIIGQDKSSPPVEKFHYLRTCLKGESELLIRNLTTTGENYEHAWKTLSDYYENKRLLVRAYLASFVSLSKMKSESAAELRKVFHCLKATRNSLDSIGRPVSSSEDLFVYLAVDLLDPRSRRDWETSICETTEPPSITELETFLDRRLHALESMLPAKADSSVGKPRSSTSKPTRSHHVGKREDKSGGKPGRCSLCQGDHFVMLCEDYRKKTAVERKQHVTSSGLCLNCLGRHKVGDCISKKDCSACGQRHHSSLHDACRENEVAKTSHVARGVSDKQAAVLLATARIRVEGPQGRWCFARALVDQGSETSLISERLTQRLHLPRALASVAVYGVGGQKTCVARGRVALSFSSHSGGVVVNASALVLPRLTVYAGRLDVTDREWPHLRGLELADPEFGGAERIDVLLGADVFASIILEG
ncbi:PREDICTED: uncharacterized protein LOC105559304, partial [Vollenhovia emeryi]|uniref:uncharacterized protein LOC105559304 n=1 Tax=Vollenhovia emeryi TaxID=411798 RepID=UPI0005F38BED